MRKTDAPALALAEVSGEDDDGRRRSRTIPAAKESDRERIDRRRREKLAKSVERLRKIMEESRRWLDFRETQFRAALDCSLRLMEIEGGLTPEPTERPKARRYVFPTTSLEKNPTWRETLNSLRAPRRRGEDLGSWYARCPIRPIVFEDPGVTQLGEPTSESDRESRIEPVHMHLEHRISQRLLGRFQSQGFMYKDLSRACLAQTKGSLPLVYLIGRLCLYGHQATRLHEDVIAVCAEWTQTGGSQGGLQPVDPKRLGRRGVHAATRRRFTGGRHQPDHRDQAPGIAGHRRSGRPRASGPSGEEGGRPRDHDSQGARSGR